MWAKALKAQTVCRCESLPWQFGICRVQGRNYVAHSRLGNQNAEMNLMRVWCAEERRLLPSHNSQKWEQGSRTPD